MPSDTFDSHGSGTSAADTEVEADSDEMHRLHSFTLIQRFLVSFPALFVVLLPAIRNPDAGSWVSIGSLVLYGVFVLPIFVTQYVRFRYAVNPDEIVIHKGVFTYQHRNIPIERIQNIEIEQSLVPRMFGTARVKVETAGSRSTEGVIEYVSLEEARRIRSTVRAYQRARAEARPTDAPPSEHAAERPRPSIDGRSADGGSREPAARAPDARDPDATDPDPPDPDAGRPMYTPAGRAPTSPARTDEHASAQRVRSEGRADDNQGRLIHAMPLGRVLLSGAFRFSLLYIVAIFSMVEYLGVNPEEITMWMTGDRFEAAATLFEREPWLVVLATAFMVMLLAWLTGIATNLNKYYGFRLLLDDDKLHIRHGLMTVSEGTIPLKKVQALLIRTNPLMSAFGWYRLELQTVGFDPNDRGYRVAAPFTRWEDLMNIARIVRPVDDPGQLESVSRLMIRRTFVRYTVLLGMLAGGIGYFWTPALWAFALVPVLLGLAFLQYRHHGFRMTDEYLYVRRGVFRECYWIIPIDRFQVFYLSQSLFQRRLSLRSVYIDTPGSGVMMHPVVVDLASEEASSVLGALHQRFHDLFVRPDVSPASPQSG